MVTDDNHVQILVGFLYSTENISVNMIVGEKCSITTKPSRFLLLQLWLDFTRRSFELYCEIDCHSASSLIISYDLKLHPAQNIHYIFHFLFCFGFWFSRLVRSSGRDCEYIQLSEKTEQRKEAD